MPAELAAIQCQELLDKRDTASAFALGLVGLGGAGGLATLVPKDTTKSEAARWDLGLGISTLLVGATATILGALVHSWSSEFESQCNTKPTPQPTDSDEPGDTGRAGSTAEPDGGVQ
jgi:hypothetical protein